MLFSFVLTALALAQDPEEEPPAEGAPPAAPGEGVPPSFGPALGQWEAPWDDGVGPALPLERPMACGVAAGCGGCCVGAALVPISLRMGLGVMASAPITYALYSPRGERYPDPSLLTWEQAEERRDAMRRSAAGVVIGAGISGAAATGLTLVTVLALATQGWESP